MPPRLFDRLIIKILIYKKIENEISIVTAW